jgi:hypothetical protein
MDHPRGGGDGDVDGHRYKLNPSGIATSRMVARSGIREAS